MLAVAPDWTERVRSLLDAPAPAVLSTYRKDGSASVSPVWFRWEAGAFEVVIAEGDVKLRHLARDPRCVLVVFEAVPPFRGVEVRGEPELVACDVTSMRASIAGRYLGAPEGERFAAGAALEAGRAPAARGRRTPRLGSRGDPSGFLPAGGAPHRLDRSACR